MVLNQNKKDWSEYDHYSIVCLDFRKKKHTLHALVKVILKENCCLVPEKDFYFLKTLLYTCPNYRDSLLGFSLWFCSLIYYLFYRDVCCIEFPPYRDSTLLILTHLIKVTFGEDNYLLIKDRAHKKSFISSGKLYKYSRKNFGDIKKYCKWFILIKNAGVLSFSSLLMTLFVNVPFGRARFMKALTIFLG